MAAIRVQSKTGMLTLTTASRDSSEMRDFLEKAVKELSSGLKPLLLVDASIDVDRGETSFYGAEKSPGLSEMAMGEAIKAKTVDASGRIIVVPPGEKPSSACVASGRVREGITGMGKNAALTLIYAPGQASDPGQHGWCVISGAVMLVAMSGVERTDKVREIVHRLKADQIPIIGAIMLKR
jgi:hypothetical protein